MEDDLNKILKYFIDEIKNLICLMHGRHMNQDIKKHHKDTKIASKNYTATGLGTVMCNFIF